MPAHEATTVNKICAPKPLESCPENPLWFVQNWYSSFSERKYHCRREMLHATSFKWGTPSTFGPSTRFALQFALPCNSRASVTFQCCQAAAKQQTGSVKKKSSPKRKRIPVEPIVVSEDDEATSAVYRPSPLPKPPAGFVLDSHGRVLMASSKRLVTIVDPANNLPLECVIRRVFSSSQGDDCMLLCPVDTPVQILRSTNFEGWAAVNDDEVESILPAAAFALAKIHMHLVLSGFCYTARGGFCYSEEDILEFRTDDGEDIEGLPTEGIEITCFHLDGSHFMIYTPSDPLLFVAVKDKNGSLNIAEDELLDDPAIVDAIDEETEFNALVEEEAALLESMLGER